MLFCCQACFLERHQGQFEFLTSSTQTSEIVLTPVALDYISGNVGLSENYENVNSKYFEKL